MTARPQLRLVEKPPPIHPLRLEIRISATARGEPFGRSRDFRLTPHTLDELIAAAVRLEGRR